MKDDTIIKIAAIGFVGLVVVPVVIGASVNLIAMGVNGISSLAYKRKIKKGLKEGTIVEIDGRYYEVEVSDVEEA